MFPIEHDYRNGTDINGTDIVLVHGAYVIGAGWLPVYEILIRDGVLGPVSGQSAMVGRQRNQIALTASAIPSYST
jgi:hypothetical protein